jgi:hypothetical protein
MQEYPGRIDEEALPELFDMMEQYKDMESAWHERYWHGPIPVRIYGVSVLQTDPNTIYPNRWLYDVKPVATDFPTDNRWFELNVGWTPGVWAFNDFETRNTAEYAMGERTDGWEAIGMHLQPVPLSTIVWAYFKKSNGLLRASFTHPNLFQ